MDEFKNLLEKFNSKVKKDLEEYRKKKEKIWATIKSDKCSFCENGVIRYEDNNGDVFDWECEDYFKDVSCRRRRGFIISIFGQRFVDTDISMFKKEIREKLDNYQFDKNLFILGGIGAGKTSALITLMVRAKMMKKTVVVKNPFDILEKVHEHEFKSLEKLGSIEILCVDDLGMEPQSNLFIPYFEKLIDDRWRNKLYTIITSNYNLETIEKTYPRAYDRLIQDSSLIELTGQSKRRFNGG